MISHWNSLTFPSDTEDIMQAILWSIAFRLAWRWFMLTICWWSSLNARQYLGFCLNPTVPTVGIFPKKQANVVTLTASVACPRLRVVFWEPSACVCPAVVPDDPAAKMLAICCPTSRGGEATALGQFGQLYNCHHRDQRWHAGGIGGNRRRLRFGVSSFFLSTAFSFFVWQTLCAKMPHLINHALKSSPPWVDTWGARWADGTRVCRYYETGTVAREAGIPMDDQLTAKPTCPDRLW